MAKYKKIPVTNEYAMKNKINLLRISYSEVKKYKLEINK